MKIIKDIEEVLLNKKEIEFYRSVVRKNRGIVDFPGGFWVYFYRTNDQDFNGHDSFNYFHLKLKKMEEVITEIADLNIPTTLQNGFKKISMSTDNLLKISEKKREDIIIYQSELEKYSSKMVSLDLELFAKLKLQLISLNQSLPELTKPIICEKYFVHKDGIEPKGSSFPDSPFEMKRSMLSGCSLVLPIEVTGDVVELWGGLRIDSKAGYGFREVWRKGKSKWTCFSDDLTWRS